MTVDCKGLPTEQALEEVRRGITLEGETRPIKDCRIGVIDVDRSSGLSLLDVSMEESVPQQVQKVVEYMGCSMISLKRTEFGPLKLRGVRKGDWRELSQAEVASLKESCKRVVK